MHDNGGRSHMKKVLVLLVLTVILAAGCKLLHDRAPALWDRLLGALVSEAATDQDALEKELQGPYALVRVVDGDTLVAIVDGVETRIRLIGIDTPEFWHSDTGEALPEGWAAAEFMKALLSEGELYLELDVQHYDPYERLLAYVYLDPAGKKMVQVELLRSGMATTMTVQPNSKYQDWFTVLMQEAQEDQVGLWAPEKGP